LEEKSEERSIFVSTHTLNTGFWNRSIERWYRILDKLEFIVLGVFEEPFKGVGGHVECFGDKAAEKDGEGSDFF